jgi:hypothetical protein
LFGSVSDMAFVPVFVMERKIGLPRELLSATGSFVCAARHSKA